MKKGLTLVLALALLLVMTACAGKTTTPQTVKSINLTELMNDMVKLMPEDMQLTQMQMAEITALYGITSQQVDSFAGRTVSVGVVGDELVMVKARDGMLDKVKELFDERYRAKLAEMKDYLPDEYTKIEACPVLCQGNYVAMLVSDKGAEMAELFKSQFNAQ